MSRCTKEAIPHPTLGGCWVSGALEMDCAVYEAPFWFVWSGMAVHRFSETCTPAPHASLFAPCGNPYPLVYSGAILHPECAQNMRIRFWAASAPKFLFDVRLPRFRYLRLYALLCDRFCVMWNQNIMWHTPLVLTP